MWLNNWLKENQERKKINCFFCPELYIKGTGHTCWCPQCSIPHMMCNNCYKEAKKQGNIKDKPRHINFITKDNEQKYT